MSGAVPHQNRRDKCGFGAGRVSQRHRVLAVGEFDNTVLSALGATILAPDTEDRSTPYRLLSLRVSVFTGSTLFRFSGRWYFSASYLQFMNTLFSVLELPSLSRGVVGARSISDGRFFFCPSRTLGLAHMATRICSDRVSPYSRGVWAETFRTGNEPKERNKRETGGTAR